MEAKAIRLRLADPRQVQVIAAVIRELTVEGTVVVGRIDAVSIPLYGPALPPLAVFHGLKIHVFVASEADMDAFVGALSRIEGVAEVGDEVVTEAVA